MTINNRKTPVPAIGGFRASPASYYSTGAPGGVASGIAGSASMTFFCLVTPRRGSTTVVLFGRTNLAAPTGGWGLIMSGTPGVLTARACNGTPATVAVTSAALTTFEDFGVPYLLLASYQNGTMTFWMNGVLVGTTTLGVGYTVQSSPTTIGVASTAVNSHAIGELISDSGMLNAYDAAAYVDPIFGNGGPGLSARWLEDLRQGRYLTWPRAAVLNSDWYWAGRDAAVGSTGIVSWVDRYSAITMIKTGQPQSANFPARPI